MAWTKEQLEAINKDNSNIIVSAGAGSGKTAVLTKRVIRKLESGVDVDRLLVLTFTNEAANEMKSRIRDAIIENKMDSQLALLDSAYITTFDSFALSIVKKYHYLLNISNKVSIVDSNIILIYKYKIIDEIFENMYGDKLFNKLINDFCEKDDNLIKKFILELSDKLDLLIDKDKYINNYINDFYSDKFIDKVVLEYINLIKKKIIELESIYDKFKGYITFNLDTKIYDSLKVLFNGNSYEDYVIFNSIPQIRYTGVDKESKDGILLKEELKSKIEEIKKMLRFDNLDEIRNSLLLTKDYCLSIIEIIKKLDQKVNEYKNKYDIYEFNDIAHMAIKVVADNNDVRNELKDYFNEIMVDEYQDTSSIQEEFISLISNNNVYMVGDIKQSIYRFRNANPYIFQNKYDNYAIDNGGIKIDLLKNFRSRQETLFNINEIFNLIMDNDIGNANYLESHNMVYGNTAYDVEDTGVNNSLEIYNYLDEDDEYTKEEKELFIVAEDIINKVKNKYQVFDKKTSKLRDIRYSDICIITDRNTKFDTYKKILEYKEIPTVLYKDEELTSDDDILVLKNLISLIDYVNKRKYDTKFKYLFTSVARSFLFEYSDDMIYQIFANNKFKDDKIVLMCKDINVNLPLTDVINNIISKFDIYEKLTKLFDIDKCLVRISNLLDISNSLSALGYNITDLVSYIDSVIDNGLTVKYSINTSGGDAVKIMNIHKSKGLEFSLCYFVGMHNKFTIREINDSKLFSLKYGIILPYKKEDKLENSILHDLYVDNFFIEEISEKIRLFYVALTRCREKMIIVTSLNIESNSYSRLVPYNERIKYRSFLDILNSVEVIKKYITPVSANYTHDYDDTKIKEITSNNDYITVEKKEINLDYNIIENKHFSKEVKKVIDNDTIKKMEYGTKVHEILEYADFYKRDNVYVKKLLEKIDNNFVNVYKEYEFIYEENKESYNGVIDLMLEYDDYINIIDYKLKNISDNNYIKQLNGYKKYIEGISKKKVYTYLYSILDDELKEIN